MLGQGRLAKHFKHIFQFFDRSFLAIDQMRQDLQALAIAHRFHDGGGSAFFICPNFSFWSTVGFGLSAVLVRRIIVLGRLFEPHGIIRRLVEDGIMIR